jgi:hypothetical protein
MDAVVGAGGTHILSDDAVGYGGDGSLPAFQDAMSITQQLP